MIVDLPSTSTVAISKKLVALRQDTGAMALGRVLTLIISTKLGEEEEAIEAANDASREHPMRVIVVSADPAQSLADGLLVDLVGVQPAELVGQALGGGSAGQ